MARKSPSKYYKISLTTELEASLPSNRVRLAHDLVQKLRAGYGLLLADWVEESGLGHVSYLGVVTEVHVEQEAVSLEWVECDIVLKPNPSGKQFWRRPHFCFAVSVVERYMLDDLFAEHFPQYADLELVTASSSNRGAFTKAAERRYQKVAGYIYVLKSQYGFKIGKAINVENRTRQFGVKLPFKWEIVLKKSSEDYSRLEATLHKHFAEQRLEGEWFDLSEDDLGVIDNWE